MAMLNNRMVYTNEHSIMIFVLPGLTPARPGYPVDFSKKHHVGMLRSPGVMDIPKTVMNMGTWLNIP